VPQQLHICLLSTGRVFGAPYGGEDKFTNALGRWLVKSNHEATLIGIEFGGLRAKRLSNSYSNEPRDINIKKNRFRYLSYLSRSVIWLCQVSRILLLNARYRITVIHAQDSGYTGLAAIVAGKLLGIPVFITLHGFRYKELKSELLDHRTLSKIILPIENKLDAFTLKNATEVTVMNSPMRDYFSTLGIKRIRIFPNAVRSKDFEFSPSERELTRREFGIDKDAEVIGFVGRFVQEKNLFTLLKSFTAVHQALKSTKLILVGEGPLEPKLREYVKKTKIEASVIFCGARGDIRSILSALDIFVLPSYVEGLSTSLLEAISCGRAIVCSDIAANREVLTSGQEALFVDPNDSDSIKEAIELLATDAEVRSELSHRAKVRSYEYDEDKVFPLYLRCYEKLASKH
jgi:glycosyltransferase involved in cell wall biosynthesis